MKKGWKSKTLENLCLFSNGLWKGEKPPFVRVGVIRNTNFTKDGALDDSDIAYLDVEARKLAKRRLQFGDIILEKSGGGPKQPVGRVALFDKEDGDFSFSNFTAALRVLEPRELDFRFLHKYLHWIYISGVTEGMQSHSIGIRNLDGDAYKSIEITFPCLLDQQRIVGILDEAFEGIATAKANAERNLQNAHALFESHLQSVFTQRGKGWAERPLEAVSTILNGYAFKSTDFSLRAGVKCIKITNVGIREFVCESGGSLPESFVDKYNAFLVRKGSIVLALTRTIISGGLKVAVVPDDYDGALLNQRVASIVGNHKLLTGPFLFAYLSTQAVIDYVKERVNTLMQPNLAITDLRAMPIPVPPLLEQNRLTAQLSELHIESQRLAKLYERKLAALDELRKSLLHQAFSGNL